MVVAGTSWALSHDRGLPLTDPDRPRSELAEMSIGADDVASLLAAGPRDGDVVLVRGQSLESRLVLGAAPGSSYSHAGLIVRSRGEPAVVHIAPNSGTGGEGTVEVTPISDFLLGRTYVAARLLRLEPDRPELASTAASLALRAFREQRSFDAAFDLRDDSQLYCTELVWWAFREAGVDLVDDDLTELPFVGHPVLLPDALDRSEKLRTLFSTAATHS